MPAFRHKPNIVNATRDEATGNWIIEPGPNEYRVGDEFFRANYSPIGKEGRLMMLARVVYGRLVADDPDEPVILPMPGVERLQAIGLVPDTPQLA